MSAEPQLIENDLRELNRFLSPGNWKTFGRSLGLEEVALEDIEVKHRSDPLSEWRFQMLLLWFRQCPASEPKWHTLRKAAEDSKIMQMVEYIDARSAGDKGVLWYELGSHFTMSLSKNMYVYKSV